jgi:hypothetical protein
MIWAILLVLLIAFCWFIIWVKNLPSDEQRKMGIHIGNKHS